MFSWAQHTIVWVYLSFHRRKIEKIMISPAATRILLYSEKKTHSFQTYKEAYTKKAALFAWNIATRICWFSNTKRRKYRRRWFSFVFQPLLWIEIHKQKCDMALSSNYIKSSGISSLNWCKYRLHSSNNITSLCWWYLEQILEKE